MDPRSHGLEELRSELLRRGLPRAEVARLVEEWTDHLDDLKEEKEYAMRTDAKEVVCLEERLGKTDQLAEAAVTNYRSARFAGRHPVATFLLAPIPLLIAVWAAFWFAGISAARLTPAILGDAYQFVGRPVSDWPASLVWWAHALDYASRLVPQMLVAGAICYLALRSGRGWRWGMFGCGLVALVAGLTFTQLDLPVEAGRGRLSVGLALPPHDLWQLLQVFPPLAAGLLVIWRFSRQPTDAGVPVAAAQG